MGIAERRSREKEELRARIMEAATELFVQEGFASVSMRKIAERIEYAPSTIYLYFEDKSRLMTTIVAETFHQLSALLADRPVQTMPPLVALEDGIRIYIRFGLAHPNQYYLAFCTLPDKLANPEHCREIQVAAMQALEHLAAGLGACVAAGLMEEQDIPALTQTVWTLIHGVTSALIFKEHDPDFPWTPTPQIVDTAVAILLRGLLKPGS